MTQKILTLTMFVCLSVAAIAQTSSLTTETKNNTSACSTSTFPSYCFEALPNLTTASANTNVQTQILTPLPRHVSPLTVKKYLYSGATTRIVAAYQPWFSPATGSYPCYQYPSGGFTGTASHPCSGYSENNSATVKLQHTTMHNLGFTDVSPDWYGNCNLVGCASDQTFLNNTVIAEAADLATRGTGYLQLMIMIDKGLITSGMAASSFNSAAAGCPTSSTTTSCVTSVLEAAYDYIDGNWGRQSYYSRDPVSGFPMTLTFIIESDFHGPDWSQVWANVKAYMSRYATPYKIVKTFGNFTEANIDGAYIWPQPLPFDNTRPNSQLCWAWPPPYNYTNNTCSTYNYITDYYGKAQAAFTNNGAIQMGGLYVGFDGSNNNYNHNILARQCGQVLRFLGDAVGTAGYSSSKQLPWLLVATWNDFGEGSNVENGVDNCWRIATPTMSGSVVTWTQTKTDATYASPNTIDHFKIWYGSGSGDLTLSQDNIAPGAPRCNAGATSCSFDLSTATHPPPTGTWYIYIEQIPRPLLFTEINGGGNGNGGPVIYTH